MDKPLVIIPTYNEIENIDNIIPAVMTALEDTHILIVDDGSPDGTGAAVKKQMENYPKRLHILEREGKGGLAAAYIAGFNWALERDYAYICEFDADFSHNPKYLAPIVAELRSGKDFVIGSRYVKGGGTDGWSRFRQFISMGGSLYSRIILRVPVMDLTGGFNFWSRRVLEALPLDDLISTGFTFQIELKTRAYRLGFTPSEYPIIFAEREAGTSKMSGGIVFEALAKVWELRKI